MVSLRRTCVGRVMMSANPLARPTIPLPEILFQSRHGASVSVTSVQSLAATF